MLQKGLQVAKISVQVSIALSITIGWLDRCRFKDKECSYQILGCIHHPRFSSCSSTADTMSDGHLVSWHAASIPHRGRVVPGFSWSKRRRNILATNAPAIGAALDVSGVAFAVLE